MGGLVSAIAFPAPRLPLSFYERELLPRADLIWLETSHGELIPACDLHTARPGLSSQYARWVILYSHGNAEDLGLHLPFIGALAKVTGVRVLSYEYVGYSLSRFKGGHPSEDGCYRSIRAAWDYLVKQCHIDPARIVVYGRSIGTGPSVDLAAQLPTLGGLLLQSPLESAFRAAVGYVSSHTMYPLDIFRNYQKIAHVDCPVAIIHGTDDHVVPCDGGKNLHHASKDAFEPCWLEGYGHNDMPYSKIFAYLTKFLDHLNARADGTDKRPPGMVR